jgi:hypothetical protein
MIASFWQAVPTLSNQQVLDFIKQSADKYSNPNNQYGYGIPDFQKALTNAELYLSNLKAGFTIYPNPTSDVFYIKYADEKPIQFTLFNSLGQIFRKSDATISPRDCEGSGITPYIGANFLCFRDDTSAAISTFSSSASFFPSRSW